MSARFQKLRDMDPTMLSFNGSLVIVAVHAALWLVPAIAVLAMRTDLDKGQSDASKLVSLYYGLFGIVSPVALVIYEIVAAMVDSYTAYKAVPQGLIFGLGYTTLALGAATLTNAVVSDNVQLFTVFLFVQACGLGMFTTFYTEFVKQYKSTPLV
jgi:hypothetical protein